jgi:hypothetical protein
MPGAADRFPLDVEEQIQHLRARKNAVAAPLLPARVSGAAVPLVVFDGVAAGALDETLDRHGAFIFPRHTPIETICTASQDHSYGSDRAPERRIARKLWTGT